MNKAVKPVSDNGEVVEQVDHDRDEEVVDKDEVERDRMVEDVLIYAVPPSDCRKQMQNVNEVEYEVREKFSSLGVAVRSIESKSIRGGTFQSSKVKIAPVNLNLIWGRRLGLENCAVIEWKQPVVQ